MRDSLSLTLEQRPSRLLMIGGGTAHLLAGIATLLSGIPLWIKAGLIAVLSLSLALQRWRNRSDGSGFVARIEWIDGRWRLETGDGTTDHAELISGYAHAALVVLNFRLENGQRRSLTLLPDSASPDALRRLRVWLRVSRDTGVSDPPQ